MSYIGIALGRDLFSMESRDNCSNQKLLQSTYGHVNIVSRLEKLSTYPLKCISKVCLLYVSSYFSHLMLNFKVKAGSQSRVQCVCLQSGDQVTGSSGGCREALGSK